jgi:hypothetical protein
LADRTHARAPYNLATIWDYAPLDEAGRIADLLLSPPRAAL